MENNMYQFLMGVGIAAVFGIEMYVLSKMYGVKIYGNDFPKK